MRATTANSDDAATMKIDFVFDLLAAVAAAAAAVAITMKGARSGGQCTRK